MARTHKKNPEDVILPLVLLSEGVKYSELTETSQELATRLDAEAREKTRIASAARSAAISQRWDNSRAGKERAQHAPPPACVSGKKSPPERPSTSNTGLSSSQPLVRGGLDTLEAGWSGVWQRTGDEKQSSRLEAFLKKLEQAQKGLQISGEELAEVTGPNGETLGVKRKGFMRGPWYFPVQFQWRGITVGVRAQDVPDGGAQVFYKVSSYTLMAIGPTESKRLLVDLFARLGFTLGQETVARADACIDVADIPPHLICMRILDKARVSVPRLFQYHEREGLLNGVSIGKTDVKLRIYDKKAELEDKPDADKQAILEKTRWGKECEFATRVEFQLRREILREKWNVTDLEDLLAKMPVIMEYLTGEWFRITDKPVTVSDRENKHQGRYDVWGTWQDIANIFQEVFAVAVQSLDWECIPCEVEPTMQIKQGSGCLSSAAAKMRMPIETLADLKAFLDKFANTYGATFLESMKKKRAKQIVIMPTVPGCGTAPHPESRRPPF